MSKSLLQPIGQKRLTNVAVVRLKKHGIRFEIACYKNKVLSWRSGVEKDLDEVLQSHTVYSNVSKGILSNSKDLLRAFNTEDLTNICLEILDKGELQVAGKERESQLSSQFRDIASIVVQKTINPETQRPYTISMIERLMHEIHFAVDPNSSSKKQAKYLHCCIGRVEHQLLLLQLSAPVKKRMLQASLDLQSGDIQRQNTCTVVLGELNISFYSYNYQALEVIRELQKHYPIIRSPMRLRIIIPEKSVPSLTGKLSLWNASIISKDEAGNQISIICEIDPGFFRDCDTSVRGFQGRLEVLAVSVHGEGDAHSENYEANDDFLPKALKPNDAVAQLTDKVQKQTLTSGSGDSGEEQRTKQSKCSTCNAVVGDARQYREHFKSDWHKQNLKRKTRNLPPLPLEECLADSEIDDAKADLKEYSF